MNFVQNVELPRKLVSPIYGGCRLMLRDEAQQKVDLPRRLVSPTYSVWNNIHCRLVPRHEAQRKNLAGIPLRAG
jgi:hypothetical protein